MLAALLQRKTLQLKHCHRRQSKRFYLFFYLVEAAGAMNAEAIWQTDRPAARVTMLPITLILPINVTSTPMDVDVESRKKKGAKARFPRLTYPDGF